MSSDDEDMLSDNEDKLSDDGKHMLTEEDLMRTEVYEQGVPEVIATIVRVRSNDPDHKAKQLDDRVYVANDEKNKRYAIKAQVYPVDHNADYYVRRQLQLQDSFPNTQHIVVPFCVEVQFSKKYPEWQIILTYMPYCDRTLEQFLKDEKEEGGMDYEIGCSLLQQFQNVMKMIWNCELVHGTLDTDNILIDFGCMEEDQPLTLKLSNWDRCCTQQEIEDGESPGISHVTITWMILTEWQRARSVSREIMNCIQTDKCSTDVQQCIQLGLDAMPDNGYWETAAFTVQSLIRRQTMWTQLSLFEHWPKDGKGSLPQKFATHVAHPDS